MFFLTFRRRNFLAHFRQFFGALFSKILQHIFFHRPKIKIIIAAAKKIIVIRWPCNNVQSCNNFFYTHTMRLNRKLRVQKREEKKDWSDFHLIPFHSTYILHALAILLHYVSFFSVNMLHWILVFLLHPFDACGENGL